MRIARVLPLIFLFGSLVRPSMAAVPTLQPSVPSPATVGTVVTWTASAQDAGSSTLLYRFSVGPVNGNLQIVRDFSPSNTLDWTTIDSEGVYVIQVGVLNPATGESAYSSSSYEMLPLAGKGPVITPTKNPLVFIYSAPPCSGGATIQVYFAKADGNGPVQKTEARPCRPASTTNFYLAGMEANSLYVFEHIVMQGDQTNIGPTMQLMSGAAPDDIANLAVSHQTVLRWSPVSEPDWMLLQGPLNVTPIATDLSGNIVWYYPNPLTFLTRPESAGRFLGITSTGSGDSFGSVLRMFDLAGNTIQETNAGIVNTQLAALGKRQIGVFHHEARRLPNGYIATLGTVEQMLTDVQGPGPVDVIGDMIVVLDSNLQVVWTWDTFDFLDVSRSAPLGETCRNSGACMSHFLAPDGNDWTHANAVQRTPDGNLIISLRHLDWVLKLDYEDGLGDGHILWKLGNGGDFIIQSDDPHPWFSHQHDANFLADNVTLELFDNGNTRKAADPNANSRGQVLLVDEENRVARLSLNVDLGVYSLAVGSAQRLSNGNYHFDAGFLAGGAISFEMTNTGRTERAIQAGAPEYRTFRMADFYAGIN